MKKAKKILSTILIICIISGIIATLNKVTLNRTSQGCIQLTDFYQLKEQSVDALFIGSSHVYYSINTCMLYDDYGIAGYLLASPAQPVWISYYFLEEALKTQAPKIVVFDICTLYQKKPDFGSPSWLSLISMKPSFTKWKAIQAVNSDGKLLDSVGAFFSFPYYHTRYSELTMQDYANTEKIRYNGYHPDFTTISKAELAEWENIDKSGFGETEPITQRAESYLRRLIELCQSKDIPLLFVNAPYANHTAEKQQAYNYVGALAAEYGIPLLDANYINEIQIDFSTDLLEPSHLNYYGSVKYTDYLARWLSKNYSLPDRRQDENYSHWKDTSTLFWHKELSGRKLREIDSLPEYAKALSLLDGCTVAACQNPGGRAVIYDNGLKLFTGLAGQEYFKHLDLGCADLAVSGGDGTASVFLDHKEYSFVDEGWNILIYDNVAKCILDGVGFPENGDGKAVRAKIQ